MTRLPAGPVSFIASVYYNEALTQTKSNTKTRTHFRQDRKLGITTEDSARHSGPNTRSNTDADLNYAT